MVQLLIGDDSNPAADPGVREVAQNRKKDEHRCIGVNRSPDRAGPACHVCNYAP
jgi:hypothetical protein